MPDKLPRGWVETTLGELSTLSQARVLPNENLNLPYVGLKHIESQTMKLLGYAPGSGVQSSSIRFNKGDVLYGRMRPYLNKVWLAEFDGICSAEFLVFPKSEGFNSQFLAFRLNSQDFVNFANQHVSGERPRVDFDKLAKFEILLAPKREQERIIAKLNELQKRIAAGESAAYRALEQVQSYRAAVLHSAVTGELTREWRAKNAAKETGGQLLERLLQERRLRWEEAETKRLHAPGKFPEGETWKSNYQHPSPPKTAGLPNLPEEWTWVNLNQLKVHSIYGPRFGKSDYTQNGVAVLRTTDIDERGRVSLESCPKLDLSDDEYEKYKVEVGDLLITRTGSIGTLAIFKDTVRAIPGAYLLHYRLISPELVEMAYIFLRSPEGQNHLHGRSAGSGRQNLSIPRLENIPMPLPPLAEQAEIVREVERRFEATDRLAATIHQQLVRSRETGQSLPKEAFAGKLAPQDPSDEPASVLLEHIRAAHKTEANKPKPKRLRVPRMPKSSSTRRPLLDVLSEQDQPISPEQLFRDAGFQPADADAFYRELVTLRPKLQEKKPNESQASAWPRHVQVLLELREN